VQHCCRHEWSSVDQPGAAYLSEPQIPLRNINWLKEGRWVHLAKVDFENYFINKIKLNPARLDISVNSHVATLVRKLQAHSGEAARLDAMPRVFTKSLEVRVTKELNYDLQAFSKTLGQDEGALAAALLESALRDARTMLQGAELDDLQKAKHDLMVADLPENQPGVEFHGGGT